MENSVKLTKQEKNSNDARWMSRIILKNDDHEEEVEEVV